MLALLAVLDGVRTKGELGVTRTALPDQALRREADGRALALLDEVGTGTDPGEGAALGIALLRALAAGGARGAAFTLATTHHGCAPVLPLLHGRCTLWVRPSVSHPGPHQ